MAKNESSTRVVVVALIEKRTSTSHRRELTRFLPDIVVIDK